MYEVEIADLQAVGLIRDQEGHVLPPEAWTLASNMRVRDDGIERVGGQTEIFPFPGVPPHFVFPVTTTAAIYWIYTSLTKAYVWDGSAHSNITRQTAAVDVNYLTNESRNWTACFIGGTPVLNNSVDPPQYWPGPLSTSTRLAALPNWPASTTALVLRSFGPYLFALNMVEAGSARPHVVRWSHPADPGTVPISWDYADATKDAGRTELTDVEAGIIQDGLTLGSNLYIYKEGATWRVTFVGGTFIFDFKPFLALSGILAPRCVALTPDGRHHFVATKDDVIVHNGNTAESIVDKKMRRYIANNIDAVTFRNSFVFTNPFSNEMFFCYPEQGSTQPNRAVIWNTKLNSVTEADVNYRWAAPGPIETTVIETWDTGTNAWSVNDGPWSTLLRRRMVLCGTDAGKFFDMDSGTTRDGSAFTGLVSREGISLVGKKRSGEPIVDFSKRKMLNRIWVRATGGPLAVRVGFQEQMTGTISWSLAQAFNPAAQHYLDVFGSGRAVSVEFSSASPFKLLSYKLVGDLIGEGL